MVGGGPHVSPSRHWLPSRPHKVHGPPSTVPRPSASSLFPLFPSALRIMGRFGVAGSHKATCRACLPLSRRRGCRPTEFSSEPLETVVDDDRHVAGGAELVADGGRCGSEPTCGMRS